MSEPLAGWYPNPSGDPTLLRYWNGEQWTDDYTRAPGSETQAGGYTAPAYQQPAPNPGYYPQAGASDNDRTLRLVAFIFCIISLSSLVLAILPTFFLSLIPLAWTIPMSVICWGIYKGTKRNTVAFGVCMLLFVNLIAGILLLASRKDA